MESEQLERELPHFIRTCSEVTEAAQSLTQDLTKYLQHLQIADDDDEESAEGVSLLDVKNMTMIQMMCDIFGVVGCKAQGKTITTSGYALRTTESRTVLEKIRPLEKKIQYQIEKIVQEPSQNKDDPLALAPDINNLAMSDDDDNDEEEGDEDEEGDVNDVAAELTSASSTQKYVAPHLASVPYDEQRERRDDKLRRKKERDLHKSSVIADLLEDEGDQPVEIANQVSGDRKNVMRKQRERREYEEDNLTRVMMTKRERNREVQVMRKSALDSITHFGDDSVYSKKSSANKLAPLGGGKKRSRKAGGGGKKKKFRKK